MVVKFNNKKYGSYNIGNKAKFLIEMKQNGFNIPDGFVLDSNCFDEVLEYNKITKKIYSLIGTLNKDNVSDVSKKICLLFDSIKFPSDLKEDINMLLKAKKKYAVRSSGTKEDLDNYSFAGQYETFLNVSSCDVYNSIIDCYKSMYSETILNYLVNNNISFDDFKMSVVVQEMIDSEFSGICFTLNPMTGNDKMMLIEVCRGLGENIVSGKVNPEQYHYDWYNDKLIIPDKNKFIKRKYLKEFVKVFVKIQEHFGYPCDIEFAISDNKLYILQSRKITKIKYSEIDDVWSTADFKDGGVSATVCTPYMWSLYEYIWEFTLKKFIIDSKILKEKDFNNKLGRMFYGRCYWNMSIVKKAMSQIVGYKEREFDSEYGIVRNYDGDGKTTKVSLKSIVKIIRIALAQNKILTERRRNADNYKEELLDKYYFYKNRYDKGEIINIKDEWYHLIKKVYLKSEATYFWQIFINTVHQSLYKDSLLKYVSESEYLSLLSNIDNISHLLPFYDMWDVSRKIRNDNDSFIYWKSSKVSSIKKELSKKKYFKNCISDIIEKYGYHSDKELDVTYPCYYELPETIISMVKDMILLDDDFGAADDRVRGKKIYNDILVKIKDGVSERKYNKIYKKIDGMRKMLWWREEFRDISTRFYYIIRVYTLELAKALVKEKVIIFPSDIWFLKIGNIFDYLDKKITKKELNEIICKNKLYYNSFRNYMSENEIGTDIGNANLNIDKNTIRGLGANNGIVTGVARVIEDFKDIDRLQENDILITKFTDTGWTPKFAILSGIVTEYGGILCHAAIVSREYGIPAIVCCVDVMSRIKDGDIITINGTTGEVIVEEDKR